MKSAVSIQCLPLVDLPRAELYRLVDAAIAVIDQSGLSYTVGPMETTIEGDLDALMDVVKAAHRAVAKAGAGKVFTYVKIASGNDLGDPDEKVAKYRAQGH